MKRIKQILVVCVLALALTFSAVGGEIGNPGVIVNPPPTAEPTPTPTTTNAADPTADEATIIADLLWWLTSLLS